MYKMNPEQFIIFDLEWNMAGRNSKVPANVREAMPYEIFEIGAIKLDHTASQQGKFQSFIKPLVYTRLNHYVARVTNRVGNSLRFGPGFAEGISRFRDFCGDDYCFCTWSDSDTKPLKENLAFHQMDDVLGVRVLDVQKAFMDTFEPGSPQRSIEYALDFLRIEKKQPFHQAVSDAWYTAEVLREVLLTREADRLAVDPESLKRADAAIEISAETIQDVMERFSYNPDIRLSAQVMFPVLTDPDEVERALDTQVYSCPACDSTLAVESPKWVVKGKHFEQDFNCSEHGGVLGKARQRRNKDGKYFLTVSLRLLRS